MPTPIETKIAEVAKSFEDFKSLHAKELAEAKKHGEASAETKQQVERASAEITRLQEQVKAMEAHIARSQTAGADAARDEKKAAYRAAFMKYMRTGNEEVKALAANSDPDGGFLVTEELSNEIVKKVFETSPVRQVASVQTISTDSLEIIQDLEEAAAGWVGEISARPETGTPQLKKLVIPVHEIYAKPKATQKILDDAFVNIEAWLSEKVADKFARTENTAFVSGDGVGKPRGFLTYAAGTGYEQIEQVNSGSAAAITADGLISLFYSLKAPYRAGSVFMMKRATVAAVRRLKDLQGQYLWQPALSAGAPDTLLGRPLYDADDMPGEGANALSVACGDFRMGYQIVDRFGIRTLRDPFSSKPNVEFYTTKRVGGAVKNFEAIKLLKCAV